MLWWSCLFRPKTNNRNNSGERKETKYTASQSFASSQQLCWAKLWVWIRVELLFRETKIGPDQELISSNGTQISKSNDHFTKIEKLKGLELKLPEILSVFWPLRSSKASRFNTIADKTSKIKPQLRFVIFSLGYLQ